jgi:tetratricopeptide (TPR) repeat protein
MTKSIITFSIGLLALLIVPSAQAKMSNDILLPNEQTGRYAQWRWGTPIPATRPEVVDAVNRENARRQQEAEAWARSPHNPENQDPEIRRMGNSARVDFYNTRGEAYHDARNFAKAISYYDKAIQTCLSIINGHILPRCATPYNNRGLSKELSGDSTGAMADYSEAIRIKRSATNSYNRGTLRRDLQDFAGALDDLNAAIALESKAKYYDSRAQVKQKLNDLSGAIQDYRKAAQMYRQEGDNESYQAVVKDLMAMNATP